MAQKKDDLDSCIGIYISKMWIFWRWLGVGGGGWRVVVSWGEWIFGADNWEGEKYQEDDMENDSDSDT